MHYPIDEFISGSKVPASVASEIILNVEVPSLQCTRKMKMETDKTAAEAVDYLLKKLAMDNRDKLALWHTKSGFYLQENVCNILCRLSQ